MRDFDLTNVTDHCYHDGTVSTTYSGIEGDFPEDETERSGLVGFYFDFGPDADVQDAGKLPEIKDAEIIDFSIKRLEDCYEVTLNCQEDTQSGAERKFHHLSFTCEYINCSLEKYKGFSYRNVYDGDKLFGDRLCFACEKYLLEEEDLDFGDNVSVHSESYGKMEERRGHMIESPQIVRNTLIKDGKAIYQHFTDPQHPLRFDKMIRHRNGHRYYAYHTDLYGLSFFDIDTGAHYDYVPEGYDHDYRQLTGESFIITDVHYDPASNMLACGGCYWAGLYEVMVLDFTNPLHYDPRAARLYYDGIFDDDDCDYVDFLRWEEDCIVLSIGGKGEYRITKDRLTELMNKKKYENPLPEFDK